MTKLNDQNTSLIIGLFDWHPTF